MFLRSLNFVRRHVYVQNREKVTVPRLSDTSTSHDRLFLDHLYVMLAVSCSVVMWPAVHGGCLYTPDASGAVVLPDTATSIPDRAFFGCTSLSSINMSNSVTSIGREAFSGCTSLTSVVVSNSVTSIGYYNFLDCTSLTSINIHIHRRHCLSPLPQSDITRHPHFCHVHRKESARIHRHHFHFDSRLRHKHRRGSV